MLISPGSESRFKGGYTCTMEKGYLGNSAGPDHESISSRGFLVRGGAPKIRFFFQSSDNLTGQSSFTSATRIQ